MDNDNAAGAPMILISRLEAPIILISRLESTRKVISLITNSIIVKSPDLTRGTDVDNNATMITEP